MKNNVNSTRQEELSYLKEKNKIHKNDTKHTIEKKVTRDTKRQ